MEVGAVKCIFAQPLLLDAIIPNPNTKSKCVDWDGKINFCQLLQVEELRVGKSKSCEAGRSIQIKVFSKFISPPTSFRIYFVLDHCDLSEEC